MFYLINLINSFLSSFAIVLGIYILQWSNFINGFSITHGFFGTFFGVFGILLIITNLITVIKWSTEDIE